MSLAKHWHLLGRPTPHETWRQKYWLSFETSCTLDPTRHGDESRDYLRDLMNPIPHEIWSRKPRLSIEMKPTLQVDESLDYLFRPHEPYAPRDMETRAWTTWRDLTEFSNTDLHSDGRWLPQFVFKYCLICQCYVSTHDVSDVSVITFWSRRIK